MLQDAAHHRESLVSAEACDGGTFSSVSLQRSESRSAVDDLHLTHGLAEEGRAVAMAELGCQALEPRLVLFRDGETDGSRPHACDCIWHAFRMQFARSGCSSLTREDGYAPTVAVARPEPDKE